MMVGSNLIVDDSCQTALMTVWWVCPLLSFVFLPCLVGASWRPVGGVHLWTPVALAAALS